MDSGNEYASETSFHFTKSITGDHLLLRADVSFMCASKKPNLVFKFAQKYFI